VKAELRAAASNQELYGTTSPGTSTSHVSAKEILNIVNSIRRPRRVTPNQDDFDVRKETKQSQVNLIQRHLNKSVETSSISDHSASFTNSSLASSSKSIKSSLKHQRHSSESNLTVIAQRSRRRVSFKETTDTFYIPLRVAKPCASVSPWITSIERSVSQSEKPACRTFDDAEKQYEENKLSANTALCLPSAHSLLQRSYSSEIVPYINDTDRFCSDRSVVEGEWFLYGQLNSQL
jgi:hypothetical protein